MKSCSVYMIGAKNKKGVLEAIKIGIAEHPEARLKALQTSNYCELIILNCDIYEDRESAKWKEKYLHIAFNDFKLKGEWFDKKAFGMVKESGYELNFNTSINEGRWNIIGLIKHRYTLYSSILKLDNVSQEQFYGSRNNDI